MILFDWAVVTNLTQGWSNHNFSIKHVSVSGGVLVKVHTPMPNNLIIKSADVRKKEKIQWQMIYNYALEASHAIWR